MKKMKSALAVLLMMSVLFTGCTASSSEQQEAQDYDATSFLEYVREDERYKSAGVKTVDGEAVYGYITDASGKPSTEDITDIMDFARLGVTSTGYGDVYLVAIEDTELQKEVIGRYTSEGTTTILVYSNRLLKYEEQVSPGKVYQPDRGYYNAGIISGYLNLAAIAHGYSTHMFQSPALSAAAELGERTENFDQFLKDENGEWLQYKNGTLYGLEYPDKFAGYNDYYSAEGLKFVCAVVIGTLNPELDVDGWAGATMGSEYPQNYSFYVAPINDGNTSADDTDTTSGATNTK